MPNNTLPSFPATLLMVTTQPPPHVIISGRTALVRDRVLSVFSSNRALSTLSSVTTASARWDRPALFTR